MRTKEEKNLFWNEYRRIKKIFDDFIACKISVHNNIRTEHIKTFDKQKSYSYVKLIQTILNNMDKEYAKLISDIFILKKNKEDLSYSSATYYNKLRRATKQFLKLTNND